jgi:hypothetical protein
LDVNKREFRLFQCKGLIFRKLLWIFPKKFLKIFYKAFSFPPSIFNPYSIFFSHEYQEESINQYCAWFSIIYQLPS